MKQHQIHRGEKSSKFPDLTFIFHKESSSKKVNKASGKTKRDSASRLDLGFLGVLAVLGILKNTKAKTDREGETERW